MVRRKKVLVGVLLAVVVVLGSIPWWLGLALRPILRARSITFERYEREGYAHFRLRNASFQRDRVTVTIETIHAPTPAMWLVQWLRSGPFLTAENWSLQIAPHVETPAPTAPSSIRGPSDLRILLRQRVWPKLIRWLPYARLKNGTLHGPGLNLTIADTGWDRGTLALKGVRRASFEFDLTATPAADDSFTFAGQAFGHDAKLQLVWSGAELKGAGSLWDQPLQLSAVFPADGWLPADASAIATNWSLPASRVKLGAPYATVHGDARLIWREDAFDLSLEAAADPTPDTKAPTISARAQAHGNLHELTLTVLDVKAPFATAKLTAPVTFSRDRPLAAESAQLTIQVDLSKLPWGEAHGEVKGTVTVNGDTAAARQSFELEFSDVVLPGFALKKAHASGSLLWPQLELTSLEAQLDDASSVEAHGIVDWQKREVRGGALKAKLGSAWFVHWLPAGASWDSADLAFTVEGPLDAPRHKGSVSFTQARWASLPPMKISATWQGSELKADALSVRVVAEHSTLELDGSLSPRALQLDRFQFSVAGQKIWQLAALARLSWSPVWQIDSLQLTGPDTSLTLKATGGPQGFFELAAGQFDSAWLQDWAKLTGPAWQLHSLQSSGHVVDDALVFDATLAAQITAPTQPAEVKLTAHGDAEGLQLKELTVTQADRVLTRVTGRLPASWRMQPTPHWQLDETAPLELSASTDPDSPLWATLTGSTGVQLTHPEAKISLTGTLRQPVGDLQVRVAQVNLATKNSHWSLPEVEDLVLDAHFDRSQITLRNFSAKLEGQAVAASGQLPMKDAGWQSLWEHPAAFDWSEAEGKLDIPDADLAALARHAPNFVAALGRLRVHAELARGGKFSGEVHVTDASSRPFPPFGTLQDINADLALVDRTLTVRSLTARLGGEPVTVDGSITLQPGAAPRVSLELKGTRIALVRTPQLLVRTDLELHALTDAAGVTHVTGKARIRDSLALANFNSLLPSGPKGVTLAPPYFSVQLEPFRRWLLDVEVVGPQAVKIRTTVFNGTASAQFHLTGTLADPRAVGALSVDQGQVLFPFAVFRVQQGSIRLSEADSFRARINVVATAQRRDYQLRLEVTGFAPAPVITMSSTPALEATDVLLMVMTGRPPNTDTATSSAQRMALLGAYLGRGIFEDLGTGGENRLEISSGEQITEQGRETYEFEYKLGERWSLVGEYDQFDSYNADVKRRLYIQESTPREKK